MKIRSITYFDDPGQPLREEFLLRAEQFLRKSQACFLDSDFEVQTIRFASVPFPRYLGSLSSQQSLDYALTLETTLKDLGYDYLSLGPALPEAESSYSLVPELIEATQNTFCSGAMTLAGSSVSLAAVRACAGIIKRLTPLDSDGFANLFFAALGNVPPGSPFFPAAYHDGDSPAFAIALEGADLAVQAFEEAASLESARETLIRDMNRIGDQLSSICQDLQNLSGAEYQGMDFSLAPYPEPGSSTGAALENLGIKRFGEHGSLAAAAYLADTIDRGSFQRTGFSGLMLPVLEDTVLAARAGEGSLGLKDLLLYSAVCGTGLDTVPLPGDISQDQICAVLTDLAVLSLRLDKPLTARLMPIPGKKAGDPTEFDFEFFANSKVMAVESSGLSGVLAGDQVLDIQPRRKKK